MQRQWLMTPPPFDDPAETFHVASKLSMWMSSSATGPYSYELATDPDALEQLGRAHPHYISSEVYPLASAGGATPVGDLLRRRHSAAGFGQNAVTFDSFSRILNESACITEAHGRGAPSAGALYPIDIYLCVNNVEGLTAGVYALDPYGASLHRLTVDRDPRSFLQECLVFQNLADNSAFHVFFVGSFVRQRIKYGQRAYRFALIEAGHIAQAMIMCALEENVVSCPVGGFIDKQVDDLLCLDGVEQSVVYSVAFGSGQASDEVVE